MSYWHSPGEGHYYYPEPYTSGEIVNRHIATLDPKNPRLCPHCKNNSASLQAENNDLYCLLCGWRDCEYFNVGLNRFIARVLRREKIIGAPVLLSKRELLDKKWNKEGYDRHRTERLIRQRDYNEKHKEEIKAYKRRWGLENKQLLNELNRRYRQEHPERYKLWQKKWREKEKLRKLEEAAGISGIMQK